MKISIYRLAIGVLVLLNCVGGSLVAQRRPFPRIRPRPPVIFIKPPGKVKQIPLKMTELKIGVKVVGNLATTTMDMIFYNDMNRVLEGQLYFPLAEGQTVSRFAMNIGGKLREGVVVPKAKGRKVFEKIVRSMIDPGLLEWTKGNNFKARVYPVPAKGYKRIVIGYEQEIKDTGNGFQYFLPLGFKKKVDKFSLRVEVFKQKVKPQLGDGNEMVNFGFKKWRESYISKVVRKNYRPSKQLVFLLPRTRAYKKIIVEKDKNGKSYFYLHMIPKMLTAPKRLPKNVCLLWDGSASGASRNIKKELLLLGRYFRKIKNGTVQLVIFRNAVSKKREIFKIRNGKWSRLYARLKKVYYDGGTSLGSLNLKKYKADEFILMSDGISTFGEDNIILSETPVMVINSKLTAQHGYLRYISEKSGGSYINLSRLTIREGAAELVKSPFRFLKAVYDTASVDEVYPSVPTVVHSDFSLSGILLARRTRITLHFGFGGKTRYTKTYLLDKKKNAGDSGLVPRVWAQKKLSELDTNHKANKDVMIATAKEFKIVTRFTSLIVLDRMRDYVKYEIVPPVELQKEYYKKLAKIKTRKQRKELNHLEGVVSKFIGLKKWWKKDFPKDKPKRVAPPKKFSRASSGNRNVDSLRMNRSNGNTGIEARVPASTRNGHAKKKDKSGGSVEGGITLAKWNPKTPYLRKLKRSSSGRLYATYYSLRKKYANSSAFYLDVADHFIKRGKKSLALRILSNIAEMELENPQLLRILGHRLSQLKYYRLSALVFQEVLAMRPEEPQSYRDLALVYELDRKYKKAVSLLYKVGTSKWDGRFPDIELIALVEMNSIIARYPSARISKLDRRLVARIPVDIRIILNWDADNTDMDLWVFDPYGEKCYYSHRLTHIGGKMSRDFTGGYGPEEFMIRKAVYGKYKVQVNYYGSRQQLIAGATTVQMQLFINYGRGIQRKKEITLRLKGKKEVITVGSFYIGSSDLKK